MRTFVLFCIAILATLSTAFADDKNSNSTESLLSNETISSNNTDASDGMLTIEEQYDENVNVTLTTNGTISPSTKGSSIPTSSAGPTLKTTTPKSGKPKAPSFTVWSFFIGIFVAFLIIGLAAFLIKFFCQRRTPGNNVPYTPYQ
ncbi:hypothetical protein CAEBREN_07699 [Caenorhabditis brenneri]|uniref:Uncharacterized protein n=1 Tax=Caenorhabditis brenneri TaxID=135651 RepID=G0NJL6_CAEBE|nr:hypothetical protein CAEBREN_07699 [Caenorhabditis brenneri]